MRFTRGAARAVIGEIHAADHALDVDRFLALLAPTVCFQLGSQPQLHGLAAVRGAVDGLFRSLAGVEHALRDFWLGERTIVFQADVTYTLPGRPQIVLPYVDVLRMSGQLLVEDYRIFIDLSPLMAALSDAEPRPR